MPLPRTETRTKSKKKATRRTTFLLLALILGLGFLCRFLLIPTAGFEGDVEVNSGWAISGATFGAGKSYVKQLNGNMLPNYPPLSILMFTAIGHVEKLFDPALSKDAESLHTLIKLPAILADLLTCLVLFFVVAWWKKSRNAGLLAALVYAFHPAVLHDGAFWGQTDSVFSFFLVCAVASYAAGRGWLAGAAFGFAVLVKMQALAVAPLFLFLGLRSGWKQGSLMACGLLAAVALTLAPYAISGHLFDALSIYKHTVGYYSVVSSAAYNAWWSLLADKAADMNDLDLLLPGLSYRTIGLSLYTLSSISMLWWLRHKLLPTRDAVPALFLGAGFLVLSFFLWNTQMHERYLFAFVPLALPTILLSKRALKLYIFVSTLFLVNLLGWLPATHIDRWAFEKFPTLDVLVASLLVATFFGYLGYLWKFSRSTAKTSS